MKQSFKYLGRLYDGMKYTAIIRKEEDMYVAKCVEIGTVSQGSTEKEALANLKEATELYLEAFPDKKNHKSLVISFEVAESAP